MKKETLFKTFPWIVALLLIQFIVIMTVLLLQKAVITIDNDGYWFVIWIVTSFDLMTALIYASWQKSIKKGIVLFVALPIIGVAIALMAKTFKIPVDIIKIVLLPAVLAFIYKTSRKNKFEDSKREPRACSEVVVFELQKVNIDSFLEKFQRIFKPGVIEIDEGRIRIDLCTYMYPGSENDMLNDLRNSALLLLNLSGSEVYFYPNPTYVYDEEFVFETIIIRYSAITIPSCLDNKRYLITQ
jgi:hypothetical protein